MVQPPTSHQLDFCLFLKFIECICCMYESIINIADSQRDIPGDDGRRGGHVRGAGRAAAGQRAARPRAGALLRRRTGLPRRAAHRARRARAHRHCRQSVYALTYKYGE